MTDQTEREALADLLVRTDGERDSISAAVDRILAAGFHRAPTPHVVTTVEELEAIPDDAPVFILSPYDYQPDTVERAYFQVASVHHLHDGRHCLCGFDSLGRARSATEHILDEYRAVLTPATPERTEQEREAAVERVARALHGDACNDEECDHTVNEWEREASIAVAAYEGREVSRG